MSLYRRHYNDDDEWLWLMAAQTHKRRGNISQSLLLECPFALPRPPESRLRYRIDITEKYDAGVLKISAKHRLQNTRRNKITEMFN